MERSGNGLGTSPDQWPTDAGLAEVLRSLRSASGLSYRLLARKLGMSAHSGLADYENGRRIPPEDLVARYEATFGVPDGSLQTLRRDALTRRASAPSDEPLQEHPATDEAFVTVSRRRYRVLVITTVVSLALAVLGFGTAVMSRESSTTQPPWWRVVVGPGCQVSDSRATFEQIGADWTVRQGGSVESGCTGRLVTSGTTGVVKKWTDDARWTLTPGRSVTSCTVEAYIPKVDGLGPVQYFFHRPGVVTVETREGSAVVDQASHGGEWVTLGSPTVYEGTLIVQLTNMSSTEGASYLVAAAQVRAACQ